MGTVRWIGLIVGGLVVVAVLALVLAIYSGPTAPVPTDPVARWNADHANLSDNAAPAYEEALALLVGDFDVAWEAFNDAEPGEVPAEVAEYVRQNATAIAIMRRAAEMENCWFEMSYEPEGWFLLDHLRHMRQMAKIMQMHAVIVARDRDWQSYADDVVATAGIARHADQAPVLISHLVSIAVHSVLTNLLLEPLTWPELSTGDRVNYISRVIDTLSPPRSMVGVLEEERDGTTWAHISGQRPGAVLDRLCPKRRVAGEMERYYAPYIEFAKLPVEDHADTGHALRKQIEQAESNPGGAGFNVVRALVLTFPPSFSRSFELRARSIAEQRGRLAVLRLFHYQHEHGAFPDSLAALGDDLPGDPYSRGPFVYRRTPGGFTLYSVGIDRDDDGGVHHPKFGEREDDTIDGDFVFWPIPDAGES